MKLLSLKGAKETIKNYSDAKKSTNKAKENVSKLVIDKAKKNYAKATGKEMTPSKLKGELEGGILSKPTRVYLDDKKSLKKDYYKKFGL